MKHLTTYLDDEINFKFGNNGSIIELKAVDDHAVRSFSNEEKLLIRIKNEESYIKTVPVTAERKIIQLPTKLLKDLTVGQYDVELWQGEGDNQIIYPDEGFLRLKIHGNASQINGSLVSSITLADFENKFNELAQKIEDKLEKLPDIDGKNISIDVKVVDGDLWINGKDTGINLAAKDGRDGRDGHTPEITVSDAGTLVVDGIDTNKSLIGPRGENGLPGKDGVAGQDGKSAYQVAVDNGFDGTEAEWLRSLHGNDGLDGKSGRDGLSAYELAKKDGFRGTEIEWLASLKGKDANPTLVLNTIHDKGFWGDATIRNSFDPQINIVTTKPLKVGNLTSITIDNVVLPGKAAIGVGTLEGNTYTFAYCKVADLAVGDTTIQLDWPIQNNNYYLFVSGKPFQTRGNGDVDAGSRFKYMLADTRNYDTGNRIKVDGESLGSFKYNFVLNYTGKTRIDLEQILKNTMPYANKKITFLGDSVTSGGTTSNGKQAFSYVDYLKDYLGAEITNKGLSGSVITEGNVENQTQSFVSRSNQIQDQDFVTIFGGINDFWFNSPLGSMEDSSDNVQSFYGALKFLVENLSKKNPIAHFLFVTPLKECKEGAPHTYEDNNKLVLHKNRAGFTEEDYVNAIKEVAAYYSVPVLDLFNSSNMNPYIESQRQYFADDLHPNQLGAQRLALIISQAINNGISSGFTRSVNGKNGLSAYEVAQKNGFSGTEQEWLDSLKGKDGQDADDVDLSNYITNDQLKDIDKKFATKSEIPSLNGYARKTDLSNYATKDDLKTVTSNTTRHAPTAWTLDRTTNPWTIWFDNGCGLQFLDYSTAPTVYGYGFSVNTQNTNIDAWPLMGTIISASRGTLTLNNISKLHGSADYWGPNTTVINPIKTDASNYDWSNVYFNDEDRAKSDDYHYNRQRNIFRVMYELGIWSIDDIKPFGLTKKEG